MTTNRAYALRVFSLSSTAIAVVAGFLFSSSAGAFSAISQGYVISEPVSIGSIVSLQKDSTDHIVPATLNNADSTIGVVVNDGSSPITLNNSQGDQAIVATSGVVQVIVSDINGAIAQGDPITASSVKGVGMKATTNTKVVGIAQGTMTGITKQKVKDDAGVDQEITLGQIPVLVSVSYHYQQPDKTIIPAALQNVANSVAGKKVDSLPIIVSAVIFIIMLITVVSIIYAMIRSSIISIGRNPMAQSAVYRDIIQLSVLVLAIISVSIIAIYFVLTRL